MKERKSQSKQNNLDPNDVNTLGLVKKKKNPRSPSSQTLNSMKSRRVLPLSSQTLPNGLKQPPFYKPQRLQYCLLSCSFVHCVGAMRKWLEKKASLIILSHTNRMTFQNIPDPDPNPDPGSGFPLQNSLYWLPPVLRRALSHLLSLPLPKPGQGIKHLLFYSYPSPTWR